MGSPLRPVDPRADFPALEERVLERWRERDMFAQSLERRRRRPALGVLRGPADRQRSPPAPTTCSRARSRTSSPATRRCAAHYVERKGGWDCHGLPVELAVETELGFTRKDDIERYGIAEFNARCREKVFSHVEDWNRLTERIGFWIDLDDAYRTLDPDYIESVWWALKTIHDKGLLYERLKVVPYCPRDGTTLSSHELGQPDVYRDVVDPSVYVRLPVARGQRAGRVRRRAASSGRRRRGRSSPTPRSPWTPSLTYVRARPSTAAPCSIVAEALVERVLPDGAEIVSTLPAAQSSRACATSRRSTSSPARPTASAATPC